MKIVGVKELKKHLSQVLYEVETTGQVIDVSNRGRVVARLIPMRSGQGSKHNPRATITDLDTLAAELSADVPSSVSVEDVIHDIRR